MWVTFTIVEIYEWYHWSVVVRSTSNMLCTGAVDQLCVTIKTDQTIVGDLNIHIKDGGNITK